MRIALTQMDIVWENKAENRKKCKNLTEEASLQGADIIVFPEMTLTGFTMNTACAAEERVDGGETAEFFKELSKKYGIAVVFGMVYSPDADGREIYNKAAMADEGRIVLDYDKIHLFSYGGEDKYYSRGSVIVSAPYKGADIGCFICYDLRYPGAFQISSRTNRIIIVIANWPESRIDHWYTLLKARAIENQSFIIGVNRTGEGDGIIYGPSSVAYSPYGERLTDSADTELLYAEVDVSIADKYREEFPVKEGQRLFSYV